MQVSANLYSTFKLFLISPHHLVWFPNQVAFKVRWGPCLPHLDNDKDNPLPLPTMVKTTKFNQTKLRPLFIL